MDEDAKDYGLTDAEREMACRHWHALMFATFQLELGAAQLALMEAPLAVQHAVMADINLHWLREYTPTKSENPFLPKA